MTTDNPRFLALVAKVEEWYERFEPKPKKYVTPIYRALKGEIMRHEPSGTPYEFPISSTLKQTVAVSAVYCKGCTYATAWPCKPWLDIESEVGK